jgi:hypothetical protein
MGRFECLLSLVAALLAYLHADLQKEKRVRRLGILERGLNCMTRLFNSMKGLASMPCLIERVRDLAL